MSTVEKLSIALTAGQAGEVREAVRRGEYASASEVIRDALRAWIQARNERAATTAHIGKLWREGLASGDAEHRRTAAEIKAEGRQRLAEMTKPR